MGALPCGGCDAEEVVDPGQGQGEGHGQGEVGQGRAWLQQVAAVRLLREAPHLLFHLRKKSICPSKKKCEYCPESLQPYFVIT